MALRCAKCGVEQDGECVPRLAYENGRADERKAVVAWLSQQARAIASLRSLQATYTAAAIDDAALAIELGHHLEPAGMTEAAGVVLYRCRNCGCPSSSHAVDDEERRECMERRCECKQWVNPEELG